MTVGVKGRERPGRLLEVIAERPAQDGEAEIDLRERVGIIHADLRIGADLTRALPLRANEGLCSPGVKLHGAGFIVTPEQATALGRGRIPGLENHIRPYLNGRDLTQRSRGVMVIDLFGLSEAQVRQRFPEVYQWVLERVKPQRDANAGRSADADQYVRDWWLFGKPRPELRRALAGLVNTSLPSKRPSIAHLPFSKREFYRITCSFALRMTIHSFWGCFQALPIFFGR